MDNKTVAETQQLIDNLFWSNIFGLVGGILFYAAIGYGIYRLVKWNKKRKLKNAS